MLGVGFDIVVKVAASCMAIHADAIRRDGIPHEATSNEISRRLQ